MSGIWGVIGVKMIYYEQDRRVCWRWRVNGGRGSRVKVKVEKGWGLGVVIWWWLSNIIDFTGMCINFIHWWLTNKKIKSVWSFFNLQINAGSKNCNKKSAFLYKVPECSPIITKTTLTSSGIILKVYRFTTMLL